MAIKLRLARTGSKKHPFYRIVAIDSHKARNGRYVERIGTYDPLHEPPKVTFDDEALERWLKVGAEQSATVARLIRSHKRPAA